MTSIAGHEISHSKLAHSEILSLVYDTLRANRVRSVFIALGMVIGTASLILVVTIAITGKEYVVREIQSIGTNMIDAEYMGGGEDVPDRLTIDDMYSVLHRVYGVMAASPVLQLDSRLPVGGGKERDIRTLGVLPEYRSVRNLIVLSGRFFDEDDERAHNKVGVVQEKLARQLFGSLTAAPGKTLMVNGLPFTLIGTFKESVDTFGESEVTENSVLIPYSVGRYFTNSSEVAQIYFSASDLSTVAPLTSQIRQVIESRHRPGSNYLVQNLTSVIRVARRTANALTIVLLLISAITLLVSGIGIMNIMLATVNSRIQEIGIRKAVGATRGEIRFQFLSEAVLLSLIGGLGGVLIGIGLPFSVQLLSHYRVPVSGISAVVAIGVSAAVGIAFGTLPANRAAQMDPVESLRHE